MDRIEIVVPRTSWSDSFSNSSENPLIPGVLRSRKSRKKTATVHLQNPFLLSKEWGEVQITQTDGTFDGWEDARFRLDFSADRRTITGAFTFWNNWAKYNYKLGATKK